MIPRGGVAVLVLAGLALGAPAAARAQQQGGGVEGLPLRSPQSKPAAVVRLPAAPPATDASMLPVVLPAGSDLRFLVDPASVSRVGHSLVRYTLVVRSPSGFRNVSYEGIDCRDDTWHVYATWSRGEGRWVANPSTTWLRIHAESNSDVHAVLDSGYWCSGKWAAGDPAHLVQRLRAGMRTPAFVRP